MKNSSRWLLGVLLLCPVFLGCGKREYTGDDRFPLSGQVTYDGEPIDLGSISFLPLDEGGKLRVSGGPIEDGEYSVPEARGAHAGTYRIEIRWQKLTGRQILDPDGEGMSDERAEGLPAKFHKDSELTVEVDGNQTTFDFHLKSQ